MTNACHMCRVRKQRELEELSQRMRSLEQDNASLRSHVDSRNAEIARLRAVVQGLHNAHGDVLVGPHPSSDNVSPLGPGTLCQVRSLFIQIQLQQTVLQCFVWLL